MPEVIQYHSENEGDTIYLGEIIGNLAETGQVILLSGELGSGKTVIVKGLAASLNINKKSITSPTYTLINEYSGKYSLYHMDLYRLEVKEELIDIGFEDYLYREGIIVIEWPEIACDIIPSDYLFLKLKILNKDERKIEIKARGAQSKKLKKGLENYVDSGD